MDKSYSHSQCMWLWFTTHRHRLRSWRARGWWWWWVFPLAFHLHYYFSFPLLLDHQTSYASWRKGTKYRSPLSSLLPPLSLTPLVQRTNCFSLLLSSIFPFSREKGEFPPCYLTFQSAMKDKHCRKTDILTHKKLALKQLFKCNNVITLSLNFALSSIFSFDSASGPPFHPLFLSTLIDKRRPVCVVSLLVFGIYLIPVARFLLYTPYFVRF